MRKPQRKHAQRQAPGKLPSLKKLLAPDHVAPLDSASFAPPALRFASNLVAEEAGEEAELDAGSHAEGEGAPSTSANGGEPSDAFESDGGEFDSDPDSASGDAFPVQLPELKLIGRESRQRGGRRGKEQRRAKAARARRPRSHAATTDAALRRKKGRCWVNPNGTELKSAPRMLMMRADGYVPGAKHVTATDLAARNLPFDIEGTDSTRRAQKALRSTRPRLSQGRAEARTYRLDPLGVPLEDKLPARSIERLANSPLRTRDRSQKEMKHADKYSHVTSKLFSTLLTGAHGGKEEATDPLLAQLRAEKEARTSGSKGKKSSAANGGGAKLFDPTKDATMYDRYNHDPAASPSKRYASPADELAAAKKEADFLRAWGCVAPEPTLESLAAARHERAAETRHLSSPERTARAAEKPQHAAPGCDAGGGDAKDASLADKMAHEIAAHVAERAAEDEEDAALVDAADAEAIEREAAGVVAELRDAGALAVAVPAEESAAGTEPAVASADASAEPAPPAQRSAAAEAAPAEAEAPPASEDNAGSLYLISIGICAEDAATWRALGSALASFAADRDAARAAFARNVALDAADAAVAGAESAAEFAASCVATAVANEEGAAAARLSSLTCVDGTAADEAVEESDAVEVEVEIAASSGEAAARLMPDWALWVSPTTAVPKRVQRRSTADAAAPPSVATAALSAAVESAVSSVLGARLAAAEGDGAMLEAAVEDIAGSALALVATLSRALCSDYPAQIDAVVAATTQWGGLALDAAGERLVAGVTIAADGRDDAVAAALTLLRARLPAAADAEGVSASVAAHWRALCADWSAIDGGDDAWHVPAVNAVVRAASIGLLDAASIGAAGRADAWCALASALLPRALARNEHFALDGTTFAAGLDEAARGNSRTASVSVGAAASPTAMRWALDGASKAILFVFAIELEASSGVACGFPTDFAVDRDAVIASSCSALAHIIGGDGEHRGAGNDAAAEATAVGGSGDGGSGVSALGSSAQGFRFALLCPWFKSEYGERVLHSGDLVEAGEGGGPRKEWISAVSAELERDVAQRFIAVRPAPAAPAAPVAGGEDAVVVEVEIKGNVDVGSDLEPGASSEDGVFAFPTASESDSEEEEAEANEAGVAPSAPEPKPAAAVLTASALCAAPGVGVSGREGRPLLELVGVHPTSGERLTWEALGLAPGCRIVLAGDATLSLAALVGDTKAQLDSALETELAGAAFTCEYPAPPSLFEYRRACEAYWPNARVAKSDGSRARFRVVGAALGAALATHGRFPARFAQPLYDALCARCAGDGAANGARLRSFDRDLWESRRSVQQMDAATWGASGEYLGAAEGQSSAAFASEMAFDALGRAVQWQLDAICDGFLNAVPLGWNNVLAFSGAQLRSALTGGGSAGGDADDTPMPPLRELFWVVEGDELVEAANEPLRTALWGAIGGLDATQYRAFLQFVTVRVERREACKDACAVLFRARRCCASLAHASRLRTPLCPRSHPLSLLQGSEHLPLPKTESIKVEMPFVAFGADEELALFETLPQSHTCDNVLEIPNYWRSLLAVERAASAHSVARAVVQPAAAELDAAATPAAATVGAPTVAAAAVAAVEEGEGGASAPAEDSASGGAATEAPPARPKTQTEEEDGCDRDDTIATDVTPTAEQRDALHAHVRAKLILAITMTSSYGLDDA